MFLQVSVILFTGGGSGPGESGLAGGGAWSRGGCLVPGGAWSRGVWSRGMPAGGGGEGGMGLLPIFHLLFNNYNYNYFSKF